MKVRSGAVLLFSPLVILRFIPPHIWPLSGSHSAVVCLSTSMHSSHSSPPWMKISWLPEREVVELFPSVPSLRGERRRDKGGEEDVWVHS